jgi:hypothetical protein
MPMTGAHRGHVLCALCRAGAGRKATGFGEGRCRPARHGSGRGRARGLWRRRGTGCWRMAISPVWPRPLGTRAIPAPDRA